MAFLVSTSRTIVAVNPVYFSYPTPGQRMDASLPRIGLVIPTMSGAGLENIFRCRNGRTPTRSVSEGPRRPRWRLGSV